MAPDLWVFGYGSLIFRADFPYADKMPATIQNWQRRFWQGSTDHRGTEAFPGRVVTLIEAEGTECWGMAYRIRANEAPDVLDHLDYREKNGYQRLDTRMRLADNTEVDGLTYHATSGNPDFIGDAPKTAMVSQISRAVGPSGPNREYLLKLESSLKQHGVIDAHVFELAEALRHLESQR